MSLVKKAALVLGCAAALALAGLMTIQTIVLRDNSRLNLDAFYEEYNKRDFSRQPELELGEQYAALGLAKSWAPGLCLASDPAGDCARWRVRVSYERGESLDRFVLCRNYEGYGSFYVESYSASAFARR